VLARAGLRPLVLERGQELSRRRDAVEKFRKTGLLDPESNVQFGEGGAGTFSDGKLNTGIRDKENRNRFVLDSFVKYGAPETILSDNKPHIGSDVLKSIVKNIRCDIIDHGGNVRFRSAFSGFETDKDGLLKGIYINDGEYMDCKRLILAIGHSARDTFEVLRNASLMMEPKSFAVGLRVQHLQADINRAMYGEEKGRVKRNADYKLTFRAPSGRGVYSFCMCPGGYVVNSSSERDMLCVNGMSYSGRDGINANSAIVVTVTPDDYADFGYGSFGVLSGMEFQRELERRAFSEGKGLIPCQRLEDFRKNRLSNGFGSIKPQCKGGYSPGNLKNILPDIISSDIISAFASFGQRIGGFDSPDSLLSGVESRTSSPVRILRNENFISSVPGIFPAGEGAGYAGGIMSAAIDGLKCAEALLKY
ncbi:MAG: FAD-dependent oxidoreductase, partial [Lachnospiraceae bacterium]|nr:FAD-dependent oxidoreductase [Lachnospiraceae bacterium]